MAISEQEVARAKIVYEGDASSAVSASHQASESFDKTTASAHHAKEAHEGLFAKVREGAGEFARMAVGVLGVVGVIELFKGGIESTIEALTVHQQAEAQLNAVLTSTQGIAGVTAEAANKYAESLSGVTRYSKDAVLGSEDVLLGFQKIGKDIFPQAEEAALNLSTRLGKDLTTASILLGKALDDPVKGMNLLHRSGVDLTDQQKELVKQFVKSGDLMGAQKVVLDSLAGSFGGAARAAGETFAGRLDILNHKFEEMKISLAEKVLPYLEKLMDWLTSPAVLSAIGALVEGFGTALAGAIQLVVNVIGALMPIATGLANFLKDNWVSAVAAAAFVLSQSLIPAIVTFATVSIPAAIAAAGAFLIAWGPVILIAGAIALAVAGLKLAWDNNFLGMRDILQAVAGAIGTALGWIGDRINDFLIFLGLKNREIGQAGADGAHAWGDNMNTGIVSGMPVIKTNVNNTVAQFDRTDELWNLGWNGGGAPGYTGGLVDGVNAGASLVDAACTNLLAIADRGKDYYDVGYHNGLALVQGQQAGMGTWAQSTSPGGDSRPPGTGTFSQDNWRTWEQDQTAAFNAAASAAARAASASGGIRQHAATAAANIKSAAQLTQDAATAALNFAQHTASAISAGVDALSKLIDFKKPTDAAMQSFVDAIDFIGDKFKQSMFKWNAVTLELAGQFGEGMGKLVGGVGAGIDTLMKLGDFKRPSDTAMQAFADAVDFLSTTFKQTMFKWNKDTLEIAALFGEGIGKLIAGIGQGIDSLIKLTTFKKPSDEAMQGFSDAVDFLSTALKQVMFKWNKDTLDVAVAFGEGVGKLLSGIGAAIDPLLKLASFKAPTHEAITIFIASLEDFITAFDIAARDFAVHASPIVAALAETVGKIAAGIGQALDPITKMGAVQAITREQIEGAFSNIWFALHELGEVMKSGELQGDFMEKAIAFSTALGQVFTNIKQAVSDFTDKSNADSIVKIWRDGMNDIFQFTTAVWGPQMHEGLGHWLVDFTSLFHHAVDDMVNYWNSHMSQLQTPTPSNPPGSPPPPPGPTPTNPAGLRLTPAYSAGAGASARPTHTYNNCLFVDGQFVAELPGDTHNALVALARRKGLVRPGTLGG